METKKYDGKILQVTEETINGLVWERCYLPDGVIIFPFTKEGKILFIKEKRPHETPNVRLKSVSGILESDKGTPEENANREMQEEIGFKGKLTHLLTLKSNGTVNNTQHFFMATNLEKSKLPNPDGEDTIMEVVEFDLEELFQMYMTDQLRWSHSTLGFLRLYHMIKAGTLSY